VSGKRHPVPLTLLRPPSDPSHQSLEGYNMSDSEDDREETILTAAEQEKHLYAYLKIDSEDDAIFRDARSMLAHLQEDKQVRFPSFPSAIIAWCSRQPASVKENGKSVANLSSVFQKALQAVDSTEVNREYLPSLVLKSLLDICREHYYSVSSAEQAKIDKVVEPIFEKLLGLGPEVDFNDMKKRNQLRNMISHGKGRIKPASSHVFTAARGKGEQELIHALKKQINLSTTFDECIEKLRVFEFRGQSFSDDDLLYYTEKLDGLKNIGQLLHTMKCEFFKVRDDVPIDIAQMHADILKVVTRVPEILDLHTVIFGIRNNLVGRTDIVGEPEYVKKGGKFCAIYCEMREFRDLSELPEVGQLLNELPKLLQ